MKCDGCGTRLDEGDEFVHRGSRLCAECTGAFVSWLLDGGQLAEPDLWAWVLDDEVMA